MKNNQIGPKGSRGDPPIASGSRGQPPWIFNDPWGDPLVRVIANAVKQSQILTDCFVPRNDEDSERHCERSEAI